MVISKIQIKNDMIINFIKFERICMQNNIPATTIGRVTGDGNFTFNDLIDVQVKDLKNLMTVE